MQVATIHNESKMGFKLAALFANWYLPDAIWASITLWSVIQLEWVERAIIFMISAAYAVYRILMLHEERVAKKIANRKAEWELEQSKKGVSVLLNSKSLDHPDLLNDLEYFNELSEVVHSITRNTKADRFLILVGFNGEHDFRFARVLYEFHKTTDKLSLSVGAKDKYVNFEFDVNYNKMLKRIELTGYEAIDVALMAESDLKEIYKSEQINYSNIYYLYSTNVGDKERALFYTSIATHDSTPYTASEKVHLKTCVDKLRAITKDFLNK